MSERSSPRSADRFFCNKNHGDHQLLKEQFEWQMERDQLRQENADMTEKINQLEVAVGQLLKECI